MLAAGACLEEAAAGAVRLQVRIRVRTFDLLGAGRA
jgi:hypothetical protein